MRIIRAIILYTCTILMSSTSFAEQTYCLKQGSRIKAVISKDHLNRIWFSGKHIMRVLKDK
jgi:hypothetical protein